MKSLPLPVAFRAAQLYAHNAHNLATGCNFFSDHEFLGELYAAYESAYDSLIERMIGLGQDIKPCDIALKAADFADKITAKPGDNDHAFSQLMLLEREIIAGCESMSKSASLGTQNLLAQFADDSEARQYKIGRRLMQD